MAFRKVWFVMLQLIGLGLAQFDMPVPPVQDTELNERSDSCPKCYQEYNHFCYSVFNTLLTRDEAELKCNEEERLAGQGTLVSILNKEENEFVGKLWDDTAPHSKCKAWIGLKDVDGEGNGGFSWSDGNAIGCNTSWKMGQPKTGHSKYCAVLYRGEWKTASCEKKLPFVCKVPL